MRAGRKLVCALVMISILLNVIQPVRTSSQFVAEENGVNVKKPVQLLSSQPLDPSSVQIATTAQQNLVTQQARSAPEPVTLKPILPPGTIPSFDNAAKQFANTVYLPVVALGWNSKPVTELTVLPEIWTPATASWNAYEQNGIVVRYPHNWSMRTLFAETKAFPGLRVDFEGQVIEISVERDPDATSDKHPDIAAYQKAGYAAHRVTVKGIPGWEVKAASPNDDFCHKVIVRAFDMWIQFTSKSIVNCPDPNVFVLVMSSLQFVIGNADPVEGTTPPGDSQIKAANPLAPDAISAIYYDRTAAYNYAYNWYDVFDNVDGYHYWCGTPYVDPPCDGAHFLAHIMQAGGLPIHWNAGQDHNNPIVYRITNQRSHVLNTGWSHETSPGNLENGDMVYYRPYWGDYCWGSGVIDPNGNRPLVAVHSILIGGVWHAGAFGYAYDTFRCPAGTPQDDMRYSAVKIDTPLKLSAGLTLNPSAQQTNENVTANFTVRNSGASKSVQLRARVNGASNFATRSVTIGSGQSYNYSEARAFADAGTFQVCAQMNDGDGWVNVPPAGGTQSSCRTMDILSPEDIEIRLNNPLALDPDVVDYPGADVQATFGVVHSNASGKGQTFVDDFRARVDKGSVQFPVVNNVTLDPGDTYNYNRTAHFTEPDLYEVKAEHRVVSVWKALLGEGSAILRVMAPTPDQVENKIGEACYTCGYWGDPVNTATGNYAYDFTDMSDPTPGLPLQVTRWYNTLIAPDLVGPFGYGSTWLYGTFIEWRQDKTAVLRMYDGHTVYFIGDVNPDDLDDMSGVYHNQDLDQLVLTRATNGTATLVDERDQTTYQFNADGQLIRISDPYPSSIDLTYSSDRLTQITHSNGVEYTITYNAQGYIQQVASSTGRSVSYTYSSGNLTSMTRADGATYTYQYDDNHRLTEAHDPNGHPYVRNFFDSQGRVTKQYDQTGNEYEFGYGTGLTSTHTFTDPLGNTIAHFYNDQYQLIQEVDELGYTITRTYNTEGNVLSMRDENDGLWIYTYDTQRNRTSETDPLGYTKVYTYDASNNLTAFTDAMGETWTYTYDVNNRLTQSTDPLGYTHDYAYDSQGNLIWEKDEAGAETWYGYNDLGFQTAITDTGGNITRMVYDEWGNQTVYTDALGNAATFVYDARNRLVESTDPKGNTFHFTYDDMGNLLNHTDGLGYTKTYTYDEHDRIIVETDFAGNPTYYAYDALGHRVVITDALGNVTRNTYDARGQLVRRIAKDGGVTTFEYDPAGNLIRETDPLGRVTEYVYDTVGRQTEIRKPCDVCVGGFAITYKEYDDAGRVILETAPNGAMTEYAYDPLGRQAVMTDTYGATIAYTYDAKGNVIQEVDKAGTVTRYGYNLSGQLITTTNALGYQSFQYYDAVGRLTHKVDERGNVTTYTYDANDNMLSMTDASSHTTTYSYDANNRRIAVTDPLSRTTITDYDASGNVVSVTNPLGYVSTTDYDVLNRPIRRADAAGAVTAYSYDAMGRLVAETNLLGHTRVMTYDLAGRRVAEQTPLGYTTVYTYDVADNQIARRSPDGALWQFEYDEMGNQTRQIDPLGNVRQTEYDLLNRPLRQTDETGAVTRKIYDAAGRLAEQRDPRGMPTYYGYDLLGRQQVMTDALGYTQVYTYDGAGNLVATQDGRGSVTQYVYDALNRQMAQIDPHGAPRHTLFDTAGQVTATVDYAGFATRYVYDAAGNQIQTIDPYGQITSTGYDAAGRPILVTDPLGRTRITEYNAAGQVIRQTTPEGRATRYQYDAEGRQIARIDGLGHIWRTDYDAAGHPVKETDPLGRVTTTAYDPLGRAVEETDALDRVTRYHYDGVGRLTAVIGPDGTTQRYLYDPAGNLLSEQDGNGHATQYQYDALNRLHRKIDPLGHVWTYAYDASGNQTDVYTPEGHHVHQDYDALNRLTSKVYDGQPFAAYLYDRNGNRIEMNDRTGYTIYTYDALNRLTASSTRPHEEVEARLVQYLYDAAGQKTRLIYPDGETAQYQYDADGLLVQLTAPDGAVTTYTRDALGRPTLVGQGNGVTVATTYDAVGNTLDITQRDAAGETFAHHTYTVDDANRRLQQVEVLPQGTFTTTYAYDALDRLTHSQSTDGRETHYAFDDAGNRLAMWGTRLRDGELQTYRVDYAYNAANQLRWAEDSVTGLTQYTYDADGRRTGMQGVVERQAYSYDAESHLTEAHVEEWRDGAWQHKAEMYEQYGYDGDSRRTDVDTFLAGFDTLLAQETTLYDNATGWDVLQTYQDAGEVITDTLFLNDEFLHKLAYWQDEQARYFQNDVLGSVLGASDSSGSAGDSGELMRYDDYGDTLASQEILPTSDGFTGYSYDVYTGLNYARNRWYDPLQGTFLTSDPYPIDHIDLLSLGLYLYLKANPVNATDPLGMFGLCTSPSCKVVSATCSSCNLIRSEMPDFSNKVISGANAVASTNTNTNSAFSQHQTTYQQTVLYGTAGTNCGDRNVLPPYTGGPGLPEYPPEPDTDPCVYIMMYLLDARNRLDYAKDQVLDMLVNVLGNSAIIFFSTIVCRAGIVTVIAGLVAEIPTAGAATVVVIAGTIATVAGCLATLVEIGLISWNVGQLVSSYQRMRHYAEQAKFYENLMWQYNCYE